MSQELSDTAVTLIPQGVAYGLLISLSVIFCGVILIAIKIQKAYLAEDSGTSEMFMVANRSVGTGLTASAVFSSWMWINETVYSASLCYTWGLALPFWFATGLCFQIALMAALGVLAKIRVPYAHTSLEIVRVRYGKIGHIVFVLLNITNNVFGCAAMILTGSQLAFGISGMHIVAATILIPVGVVLYTAVGGLKATFLTDYLHTTVALILIIYFTLSILTNQAIGGLGGLYDKIVATASENFISGNYQGSLLTMKSKDAIIWGLLLKLGNLALVVMDTAFWQKSFATEVYATVPGYNLAALAIFGVPWGLGTVIGLTARAIHNTPLFPTYPNDLSPALVGAGLVMPYTIKAIIGDKGVVAFFVLLFMALTSTISSSMIAVSSILSYDLYKTYVNPKASDKRIMRVSHIAVVFHAFFIAGISLALNYGGADLSWITYFLPILCCPGIIPLILTISWSRQTKLAAAISPILGFITGLTIWLVTTKTLYQDINMTTTKSSAPSLYGALASFLSPALYSVLISFYKPYRFDWRQFLRIELANTKELQAPDSSSPSDDEKHGGGDKGSADPNSKDTSALQLRDTEVSASSDPEREAGARNYEKQDASVSVTQAKNINEIPLDELRHPFSEETLKDLYRWYRFAWIFLTVIVLVTFIAWPLPLYRDYIFTKSFFSGWTSVAIGWQFFAFFAVVVYPLYDGRHAIAKGSRGVWKATKRLLGSE